MAYLTRAQSLFEDGFVFDGSEHMIGIAEQPAVAPVKDAAVLGIQIGLLRPAHPIRYLLTFCLSPFVTDAGAMTVPFADRAEQRTITE